MCLPGRVAAQATASEQVAKDDAGDLRLHSWCFLEGSTGVPQRGSVDYSKPEISDSQNSESESLLKRK